MRQRAAADVVGLVELLGPLDAEARLRVPLVGVELAHQGVVLLLHLAVVRAGIDVEDRVPAKFCRNVTRLYRIFFFSEVRKAENGDVAGIGKKSEFKSCGRN